MWQNADMGQGLKSAGLVPELLLNHIDLHWNTVSAVCVVCGCEHKQSYPCVGTCPLVSKRTQSASLMLMDLTVKCIC